MITNQNKRRLFLYLAPVFIFIFVFFVSSYPPIKAHASSFGLGSVTVSGITSSCTSTNPCTVTVTVSGSGNAQSGSTTFTLNPVGVPPQTHAGIIRAVQTTCTLPCNPDGLTWSVSGGVTAANVTVNGVQMDGLPNTSTTIPSNWITTTPLVFNLYDESPGNQGVLLDSTTVTGQNGGCGTANKSYPNGSTSYGSDTFCTNGNSTPSSPAFPSAGGSTPWTCGGGSISCSASQVATPAGNCTNPGETRFCTSLTSNSCGQSGSGQEICGSDHNWGACSAVAPSDASCTPVQGSCSITPSPTSGVSPLNITLNVNNSVTPFYHNHTLQPGQASCQTDGTGCQYNTTFSCQGWDSYGHPFAYSGASNITLSTPGVDTFQMNCSSNSYNGLWGYSGETPPSPYSCRNYATVTASPNGVCGTANGQVYPYTTTSFGSDTICAVNGPVSNPTFPAIGSTVSWTCQGTDQGVNASCSASRAASPSDVSALISADPTSIYTGETSTLTWSSTNATSCTGTNFSTGNARSGSLVVTPLSTTTYSVTCTSHLGGARSATGTVTVTVKHKPAVIEG